MITSKAILRLIRLEQPAKVIAQRTLAIAIATAAANARLRVAAEARNQKIAA